MNYKSAMKNLVAAQQNILDDELDINDLQRLKAVVDNIGDIINDKLPKTPNVLVTIQHYFNGNTLSQQDYTLLLKLYNNGKEYTAFKSLVEEIYGSSVPWDKVVAKMRSFLRTAHKNGKRITVYKNSVASNTIDEYRLQLSDSKLLYDVLSDKCYQSFYNYKNFKPVPAAKVTTANKNSQNFVASKTGIAKRTPEKLQAILAAIPKCKNVTQVIRECGWKSSGPLTLLVKDIMLEYNIKFVTNHKTSTVQDQLFA